MSLGTRLKAERQRLHLTQIELAARARVSQPLIARLELDQIKEPAAHPLGRIARTLGISLDYLIGMYDEDPHPTPVGAGT